ncbi:hypothetical protein AXF42_Ash010398 [Apostasia shenzhenica]|uniref:S-adenosyl-L-methionine-dependent methyltransferase n=1 Tax=Apostasia shenzhenica TaxID=1088818 RepID=A0A2I0BDW3_9ASPA|nr:hypothetical protein AXF42_Ash010398 [Apostasia shenzhenica]
MAEEEKRHQIQEEWPWRELKLPEQLMAEKIRTLHATIDGEWGALPRTACQTAAGRALWNHVIHDPMAHVLAGESFLKTLHEKMKKDKLNNAREVSGVILAVRTLWFDSKIEAAVSFFGNGAQVVLLGAGMDARAYRLSCLKESNVFEVDFPELLQMKAALLQEALGSAEHRKKELKANSVTSVAADIRDSDWLEKLHIRGFAPEKCTVWVLEGILYYLPHPNAIQVLQTIAAKCLVTRTVLLADFMNQSSVSLSNSTFHFYSDWPEQLLPALGFPYVELSQIGDPDAHFGLLNDPQNLFNKLRNLPRSIQTNPEDGSPCCRLFLVEASGFPKQST